METYRDEMGMSQGWGEMGAEEKLMETKQIHKKGGEKKYDIR